MARPNPKLITFTIDGREVQAPENMMLVDAAKLGDVEIPVFCYEPKLSQPVGACRMCLVEIEGIPKLQTGCSTPVKDGMVVHTKSPRVQEAQQGVVEFLLLNHPLDCPVCDKGGECPLQDITFGYGPGRSRTREPKRHFKKPLELSPLIAIDRERCILCYRCARFSQEVSEDHQLVLAERGSHSYITTFDGHPYIAPFSGNIIELCPVGALTSIPYRFRARPWDIEGAGTVCTLCPAQCNVTLTVRNERVLRVLARENGEVDDGWLCDKGRFGYQSFHVDERLTTPLVRDGGTLRPVSWELALERAAQLLGRAKGKAAALVGGGATNEEGYLLARLIREGLASEAVDTTAAINPAAYHLLAEPALGARLSDLEFADNLLLVGCEPRDDAPIFELRIRKGVRHRGVKLFVLGSRGSVLEGVAKGVIRCAQGEETALLGELVGALQGGTGGKGHQGAIANCAETVRNGETVVLYDTRLLDQEGFAAQLLKLADLLSLRRPEGEDQAVARGLIGVAGGVANARGLFEAGVAPGYGPGYTPLEGAFGGAYQLPELAEGGTVELLYLFQCDPLRGPLPKELANAALGRIGHVIAHAEFLTEGVANHAEVVFPAEAYPEKEGTVVHPDGRIQRLRPAIARQGEIRAGWWVVAELARRVGVDFGLLSGKEGPGAQALAAAGIVAEGLSAAKASKLLFEAVPLYNGLTLEEVGGKGVRWQERSAAAAFVPAAPAKAQGARPALNGHRSLWDAPEVEFSPSLRFLYKRVQASAGGQG
jgi:NADH-quinone oxidoreductase subunit G